ncbi:hypothetical protein, partial [Methylosinus sp. Ce-a6]|uniref:hypothetical protein n=1 Tax=Methylosinus sp. Ce-a6 TaxID=2172005 RepID=UPI00135CDEE5
FPRVVVLDEALQASMFDGSNVHPRKVYGQTVRFASSFSGAFDRHSARHFRTEKAEASAVVEFAVELFSRTSASGATWPFGMTNEEPWPMLLKNSKIGARQKSRRNTKFLRVGL